MRCVASEIWQLSTRHVSSTILAVYYKKAGFYKFQTRRISYSIPKVTAGCGHPQVLLTLENVPIRAGDVLNMKLPFQNL